MNHPFTDPDGTGVCQYDTGFFGSMPSLVDKCGNTREAHEQWEKRMEKPELTAAELIALHWICDCGGWAENVEESGRHVIAGLAKAGYVVVKVPKDSAGRDLDMFWRIKPGGLDISERDEQR